MLACGLPGFTPPWESQDVSKGLQVAKGTVVLCSAHFHFWVEGLRGSLWGRGEQFSSAKRRSFDGQGEESRRHPPCLNRRPLSVPSFASGRKRSRVKVPAPCGQCWIWPESVANMFEQLFNQHRSARGRWLHMFVTRIVNAKAVIKKL